jgi:serine/threonine protein kinase
MLIPVPERSIHSLDLGGRSSTVSDSGSEQTNLGIPGIDSVVEIGRSTSHATYRVRDIATGRIVVVKLLNAGRDWPGLAQRFEREQSALAQLVGHPNIVPVYGHGWTETGMPYVVSGQETGGSIGDRLRGPTPMTGPDVLALGVRLAGALESAHRAGVVHGDLRPDDMMLTPEGEPLLADFGLVTLVRPNASGVTDPQELAHVPPEVLDGQAATPATDIYALASALYTLLAGEPAYVRHSDTSVVPVIKRIASDPLPDLSAKGVPASVADVVSKAMSKNPQDRYKSAQEFGRALQQSQVALGLPMTDMTLLGTATPTTSGWEGTHDAGAGAATGAAAGAAGAAGAASGAPGGPGGGPGGPGGSSAAGGGTPSKSRRPLYIALAVAAAVIIAAIAFFVTRDSGSSNAASSDSSSTSDKSTKSTKSSESTDETDSTDFSDFTDASAAQTDLANDGGQLAVSVPSTWLQTNTATAPENNVPTIQAATDLTEFFAGTYLQPGIDTAVFAPTLLDPSNLDAAADAILGFSRTGGPLSTACTRGTREDFQTLAGGLTARRELLTACNGGGNVLVLAATDANKDFVLGVEIHFGVPPDDAGAQLALDTVNVLKFP